MIISVKKTIKKMRPPNKDRIFFTFVVPLNEAHVGMVASTSRCMASAPSSRASCPFGVIR